VNWELIGHGIQRSDQLDFSGLPDKLGVFAVTIRYHKGLFYLINTCVGCNGNFYITATDPAGPWSDPVWLSDAPGIDPSLMWDDDDKCYYTGHNSVADPEWPTQTVIWNQELDLKQQKLIGEKHILTHGHANNASYTEGPHLYKINGKYLLMVSEGGTGRYHALTVHHSDSVNGPFVADYINPVMTHRHLGKDYPVYAIGHGDLVQTQNGEWWCVTLGKRQINGETTLGRETFLSKVEFEDQTPIFNPGYGRVLEEQIRPDLPWTPVKKKPARDDFDGETLGLEWCCIRTPKQPFYSVNDGTLKIDLRPEVMDSLVNSSLIIRRIQDFNFVAQTKMTFKTSKVNEQAGLAIYRTSENHYQLVKDKKSLVLFKTFKGDKTEVARVSYTKNEVILEARGEGLKVQFSFGETVHEMKPIGEMQSLIVIADGNGNQFNGPGIGMYATSNGKMSRSKAVFDWFEYRKN
jgi:alpha-N-arabinofuranosidase